MNNNKKGSYMMEAAVVLPIIVLAVITVVLIIAYFYEQIEYQSKMHMHIRGLAGAMTEQTLYINDTEWEGSVDAREQLFGGCVHGKGYLLMRNKGLLRRGMPMTLEGKAHVVNGPQYVRYVTLFKGTLLHEE